MILLDIILSKSQNSAVVLLEASNSSTLGLGLDRQLWDIAIGGIMD